MMKIACKRLRICSVREFENSILVCHVNAHRKRSSFCEWQNAGIAAEDHVHQVTTVTG